MPSETNAIHRSEFCPLLSERITKSWLASIPLHVVSGQSEPIYRMRNRLYRVDAGQGNGRSLCVKAFADPPLFRSLQYSWFGSKASRAYHNARHLAAHGVGVARPLGFFETWEGRRLKESYYVSEYMDDATDLYAEMRRLLREDPDCHRYVALLRLVAEEVRKMHDCGFIHNDLGGQNILLRRTGRGWRDICFIDLNRGRARGDLPPRLRARDLANLEIQSFFRTVFFHIYYRDGPVPAGFSRWERFYRGLRTLHNESRKFRHPIRHFVLSKQYVGQPAASPPYRDTWLWDPRSGQPAVVLVGAERRRYRPRVDLVRIAGETIPQILGVRSRYRECLADAFGSPVAMRDRIGMTIEADDPVVDAQLEWLARTPRVSVFLRVYHHRGAEGIARAATVAGRLRLAGHEVSIGLVQCRASLLDPSGWARFVGDALGALGELVRHVEIGHAVNRVKWGLWRLDEIALLWECVREMRNRHPEIIFLGPPVNDFEFHYYPPLLRRIRGEVDGLSCHLYVDRRGAPENKQFGFSLLEKCCLGEALSRHYGSGGFYVTETNWPRTGAGTHSPLTSGYLFPGRPESKLHVDEETYAVYMLRYFLISLASGCVRRVWWWRLAARGFGLTAEGDTAFQTAPCRAFQFMARTLGPATFLRREEREGAVWFFFDHATVAYAREPRQVTLPDGPFRIFDPFGKELHAKPANTLFLRARPVYLLPVK